LLVHQSVCLGVLVFVCLFVSNKRQQAGSIRRPKGRLMVMDSQRNCHKLWFSNPYVSRFQRRKPLIFQTKTSVSSNDISLKYQKFTTFGSKDTGIRKSEFVTNTQFPCIMLSMKCPIYKMLYLWFFLWNVFSLKCPDYKMFYLWNVISLKCPVYKISYLWHVLSWIWNVLSMKCPVHEMFCL